MTQKAPGRYERKGLSILEITRIFPDDSTAEKWFTELFWPDGVACPYCGSMNVQSGCKHKTMPYRCREKECGKKFSAKTKTVMEGSKLGYQTWAIAVYLLTTNLKGVSSMKLHRELDITQKSAWHLAHRLRKAMTAGTDPFKGPVEVDETYMGGKERNKHASRKLKAGRGTVGKTAIVGARDRKTGKVTATVVDSTDKPTLQGFVADNVDPKAEVYHDDARAYRDLPFNHAAVKHSVGEYVRDKVHTNGIESFWAMLKRGHKGVYHKMSNKHLGRYVNEYVARHNMRGKDTISQMSAVANGMEGKRLRYRELIG